MIKIELFGKFSISINGNDATQALGNSQKGRHILEYLILHRGEPLTSSELSGLLWPDEEISNPENALRVLVSRTRSALSRFDPMLSECIITIYGAYRWNTELPHTVDAFRFEALCNELLRAKEYSREMEAMLEKALALYKGDISAINEVGDWIISCNVYYCSLCIKTVQHAIRLMEDKHHDAGIVSVAQRGLMVDPFDEGLHLALMRSLAALNRHHEAQSHFHRTQDVYFNEYGISLPESIQSLYNDLIHTSQSLESDIDTVHLTLQQLNAAIDGAFICEYAIFRDVYIPLMRNLAHLGESCHLAVMTISLADRSEENDSPYIQKAMENLLAAIGKTLRPFDVVSRCNSTRAVMLLPSVTMQLGKELLDKIKRMFRKTSTVSTVKLTSKLVSITGKAPFDDIPS